MKIAQGLGLSIAAALTTASALAEPASGAVAAAFGNTLVSTYPDGRQAKLWLEPGGTYTGQGRRGGPSAGRWSIKGERLCMRQSRPVPVPFSFCTPIVAGGVGARWSAKAVGGEPVTVQLVAGAAP